MSYLQSLYVNNDTTLKGDVSIGGDISISGNLTISGTTTSVDTDNLNVTDRHIYLNNAYTTNSGVSGGIVVNYLPTTTQSTAAGAAFGTTSTMEIAADIAFALNDIIQISGATNSQNNGLYEVDSYSNNGGAGPYEITIKTAPVAEFVQNAFVVDATVAGTVTKVNVSIMEVSASGVWQTKSGSASNALVTKSVLLSGDAQSNANITLTDAANQIFLGPTSATIISSLVSTPATFTIPDGTGSGEFTFNSNVQTLANKTLTLPKIDDDLSVNKYLFAVSELTADRTITLPLLTGNDEFTFNNHTQTLTNKTLDDSSNDIGANKLRTTGTSVSVNSSAPTTGQVLRATSGTVATWQTLGDSDIVMSAGQFLRLDDNSANTLGLTSNSSLSADQNLIFDVLSGADTTIALGGNFTTSGANALTLTTTAATDVTLPTTGTLATLAGTETLTNKTLTSPSISAPTITGVATISNVREAVTALTTATTMNLTNSTRVIIPNASGNTEFTLPSGGGNVANGDKYTFINNTSVNDTGANDTLTIYGGGSDTIDDDSNPNIVLTKKYQRVTLQYVNAIWYIV